jgi:hypothetical protein
MRPEELLAAGAEVPQPGPRRVVLVGRLDTLRRAVAAYLARFKGQSRAHTESDLRAYLTWCSSHSLDPLTAQRPHLELYTRWMQETRRYKPSTVSELPDSFRIQHPIESSWKGKSIDVWEAG